MRVAICEDEPIFARELEKHIATFLASKGEELYVQIFPDAEAFLPLCEAEPDFHIIFMDIHLGGKQDGIELCKKLRVHAPNVPIIFVTSLENRAIDGYDVNAFGFVVKKHCSEKLPLVMEKLWQQFYCTTTLNITEKNEMSLVSVKDILWIESQSRCTMIHTVDRDYTDTRSIRHFASLLNSKDFIECFKSIFVNIEKIKSINADTLTLANDSIIPVSRRNRKSVMQAVMKKVSGR